MSEFKVKKHHRRLVGIVVSAKTDKTRQVEVTRVVAHAKYGKRFRVSRRFAAHDPKNTYVLGDKVIIEESRPMSKTKRWRIVGKV
jgi:small subunit ribosomal protein S17